MSHTCLFACIYRTAFLCPSARLFTLFAIHSSVILYCYFYCHSFRVSCISYSQVLTRVPTFFKNVFLVELIFFLFIVTIGFSGFDPFLECPTIIDLIIIIICVWPIPGLFEPACHIIKIHFHFTSHLHLDPFPIPPPDTLQVWHSVHHHTICMSSRELIIFVDFQTVLVFIAHHGCQLRGHAASLVRCDLFSFVFAQCSTPALYYYFLFLQKAHLPMGLQCE